MSVDDILNELLLKINNGILEILELWGPTIGEDRICELVKNLERNKSVKKVSLECCELSQKFACILSKVLQANKTITVIELWMNNLKNEGVRIIADAIKQNRTVTEIRLGCNKFDNNGAIAIAKVLKYNHVIQVLDLRYNEISSEIMWKVFKKLSVNRTLQQILKGVNYSNIETEAFKQLFYSFQLRKRLTNSDLHNKTKSSVVCLLAIRYYRRSIWIPKEIFCMIAQFLMITKSDYDAWKKIKT